MASRYQYIADDLRRLISSGEWLAGDRLPPETELATRYSTSTPTLRNALEVLQGEGLVEKRHGIGNFVRRPQQRITYSPLDGHEHGVGLTVHFALNVVKADRRLSSLVDVLEGTPLTEYVFTSRRRNRPFGLAHVYVPHTVARPGPPAPPFSPWGHAVRELLVKAGVQASTSTEKVIARFPTTVEAHVLGIPSRTPILTVERTSFDAEGRIVEGAFLTLPSDRAQALFTTTSAEGAAES